MNININTICLFIGALVFVLVMVKVVEMLGWAILRLLHWAYPELPEYSRLLGEVDAEIDAINSLSIDAAKEFAERLLADPAHFIVEHEDTMPQQELAGKIGGSAGEFLAKWDTVWTPLREATIGRCWLKYWGNTDFIVLGSSEDTGCFLVRSDSDLIYDEDGLRSGRDEPVPYAPSVYHLVIMIDSIFVSSRMG
jgi:hypothetical protein